MTELSYLHHSFVMFVRYSFSMEMETLSNKQLNDIIAANALDELPADYVPQKKPLRFLNLLTDSLSQGIEQATIPIDLITLILGAMILTSTIALAASIVALALMVGVLGVAAFRSYRNVRKETFEENNALILAQLQYQASQEILTRSNQPDPLGKKANITADSLLSKPSRRKILLKSVFMSGATVLACAGMFTAVMGILPAKIYASVVLGLASPLAIALLSAAGLFMIGYFSYQIYKHNLAKSLLEKHRTNLHQGFLKIVTSRAALTTTHENLLTDPHEQVNSQTNQADETYANKRVNVGFISRIGTAINDDEDHEESDVKASSFLNTNFTVVPIPG